MSCVFCRHRKIRCDGAAQCYHCVRTKRECIYAPVAQEVAVPPRRPPGQGPSSSKLKPKATTTSKPPKPTTSAPRPALPAPTQKRTSSNTFGLGSPPPSAGPSSINSSTLGLVTVPSLLPTLSSKPRPPSPSLSALSSSLPPESSSDDDHENEDGTTRVKIDPFARDAVYRRSSPGSTSSGRPERRRSSTGSEEDGKGKGKGKQVERDGGGGGGKKVANGKRKSVGTGTTGTGASNAGGSKKRARSEVSGSGEAGGSIGEHKAKKAVSRRSRSSSVHPLFSLSLSPH